MKSSLRIIYSLIVFIIGIVLLAVLTVLLIYENQQTHLSMEQVSVTHQARVTTQAFLANFHQAELIASKSLPPSDEVSIDTTIGLLEEDLDFLRAATMKVPGAPPIVEQLASLLEQRKHEWLKDDASTPTSTGETSSALIDAKKQVTSLLDLLSNDVSQKQAYAKRHSVLPAIIGIGISIFSILIFILAFYFTNTELRKSNYLNNELEAKNVQLEHYTKELSSFTHITSHDMQEPLRKIELFISLIEERENQGMSEKALQYFQKIKESANRMRQLLYSILTFSLAEEVRNRREDVDLNEVLQQTVESLKSYVKDTNAVISSGPLPLVKGVRHQLLQLFENIISNGLKYKRDGVLPEIKISYEVVDGSEPLVRDLLKDTRYYRIDFRDNGMGFDQKYVDKIFEIFQRHVRTENNSMGVGLSICRKIAQNHAGAITAESEIDKGSLFSFYIPV